MITEALKKTILDEWKRTNLLVAINGLKIIFPILERSGISVESLSFLAEGFIRIGKEIEEATDWGKIQEEFNKIIKPLEDK